MLNIFLGFEQSNKYAICMFLMIRHVTCSMPDTEAIHYNLTEWSLVHSHQTMQREMSWDILQRRKEVLLQPSFANCFERIVRSEL